MGAFLALLGTALVATLGYVSDKKNNEKIDALNKLTLDYDNAKLAQEKELTQGGLDLQQGALDLKSDIFDFQKGQSILDRREKKEEKTYQRNKDKIDTGLQLLNNNIGMRDKWMQMWSNVGGFPALGGAKGGTTNA